MGNKENNIKKPGFKTLSIHHGESFAEDTGCVMPPIFSTSTFKHGNKDNFDYTRSGNPSCLAPFFTASRKLATAKPKSL